MFIESPDGGVDFGYLPKEVSRIIRRQAGPIRLLESDLRHIEERHSKEIMQAGYENAIEFVHQSANSYNAIYRGKKGTLFLVTDFDGEIPKNVIIRLTPMPDMSIDYWAVKTASIMRREYFNKRELLLLRDSPYHTQTLDTKVPFSARPRADIEIVEHPEADVNGVYRKLLEQAGPSLPLARDPFDPGTENPLPLRDAQIARSLLEETPFDAGPEADGSILDRSHRDVKRPRVGELVADAERFHPPPSGIPHSTHEQSFLSFATQEHQTMATQPEPLFSHGPLSIVASDDEQKSGITVLHDEWDNGEFISQEDPLHKEFLNLIQKNKNSLGFVANQIQARLEQVGRWAGLSLEDEGVIFGPARGVQEIEAEVKSSEEVVAPAEGQVKRPVPGEQEPSVSTESSESLAKPEKAEEEKQTEIQPAGPETSAASDLSEKTAKSQEQESEKTNADILQNWPEGAAEKGQKAEEKQKTFVHLETPNILLSHNKRPLVLDYGDQITVTNRALFGIGRESQKKRENAVGTALSAAVERFGEPVHVVGNKAFLKQTAEMAVKMGIKLEPGDEQARKIYQEALDRAAKEKGNVLSPARSAPSKSKEQDLGIER